MPFDDLRTYIRALQDLGELHAIKVEVDWDEEIGAIAQEGIARGAPALLFENIRGCPDGRVLVNTGFTARRRVFAALDIPPDTHPVEAVRILKDRCRRPIPPTLVSKAEAPCKEIIRNGSVVNLYELPAPRWHGRDGGRYLQTYGGVVTRDPDLDWTNVGTYRGMIVDRDRLAMLLIPTQHWGLHAAKYRQRGQPMPVAIALGCDPVCPMVFTVPWNAFVNEYDMVGAVRQAPLRVVKCETLDLYVPANAEIVLEGEMLLDPEDYHLEGPFGEYTGYYTTLNQFRRPVLKVNCITHRRSPINHGFYEGTPERYPQAKPCSYLETVPVWMLLEGQGIPGITGVYGGDASPTSHTIICVSIDRHYYGQERQIAAAIWGSTLSNQIGKYVIVVDSDIDISNPGQVMQAVAHRVRPGEDIVIFPGTMGGPLGPRAHRCHLAIIVESPPGMGQSGTPLPGPGGARNPGQGAPALARIRPILALGWEARHRGYWRIGRHGTNIQGGVARCLTG